MIDYNILFQGLAGEAINPLDQRLKAAKINLLNRQAMPQQPSALETEKAQLQNMQLQQNIQQQAESHPLEQRAKVESIRTNVSERAQKQVEFVSNKYRNIQSQEQLDKVNQLAIKTGLLDENKLPQDPIDARILYEGSALFKMDLKHAQSLQEIDIKYKNDKRLEALKLSHSLKQIREKTDLQNQLESERFKRGITEQDIINKIRTREKIKQLQVEKGLGINRAPVVNINTQQGTADILPRAYGGPVNSGQPYLVGEQGPEVMVPQQPGYILPNPGTIPMGDAQDAQLDALNEATIAAAQQPSQFSPTDIGPQVNQRASDLLATQQISPTVEQAVQETQSVIPLSKPTQANVEKDLLDLDDTEARVRDGFKEYDSNFFTAQGKAKLYLAKAQDWVGYSSEQQKKFLEAERSFRLPIGMLVLLRRKAITGVAGGEKEMDKIESVIFNIDKSSPSQAAVNLLNIAIETSAAKTAKQELLTKGIKPISIEDPNYTAQFNAARNSYMKEYERFEKDFINDPRNKGYRTSHAKEAWLKMLNFIPQDKYLVQ